MKPNIGPVDRTLRVIAGAAILGAGYYFQSWWGLIGVIPIATATVRFCPAYLPFGWSTCAKKPQARD
jgi:hypothetical protein